MKWFVLLMALSGCSPYYPPNVRHQADGADFEEYCIYGVAYVQFYTEGHAVVALLNPDGTPLQCEAEKDSTDDQLRRH